MRIEKLVSIFVISTGVLLSSAVASVAAMLLFPSLG